MSRAKSHHVIIQRHRINTNFQLLFAKSCLRHHLKLWAICYFRLDVWEFWLCCVCGFFLLLSISSLIVFFLPLLGVTFCLIHSSLGPYNLVWLLQLSLDNFFFRLVNDQLPWSLISQLNTSPPSVPLCLSFSLHSLYDIWNGCHELSWDLLPAGVKTNSYIRSIMPYYHTAFQKSFPWLNRPSYDYILLQGEKKTLAVK